MSTRYAHLFVSAALMLAIGPKAIGQVTYPDHTIQGVEWTSGTHHTAVTQRIISPAVPAAPVSISANADVEFVSGTQIHLTDGFHTGEFNNDGRFRARIDAGLGPTGDVVAIAPDPTTHLQDGVVHVEKWEKLEIGLRLPQEYQDAIDRFFLHYYDGNGYATPNNLDRAHDLNPYADDSLQLVLSLTDPTGAQRLKWGFYMREGMWATADDNARLAENTTSTLAPYSIHFRFAPDLEGPWSFELSVMAPHTSTPTNIALPPLHYSGFNFYCDPPLPDNKGYLHVNQVNKRVLQFDDGTPFFGLGTNMADIRHGDFNSQQDGEWWFAFYKRDHDIMKTTMEQLHSAGGNSMRMMMIRHNASIEWVNLGVYDRYLTPPCCNGGISYASNCQWECWSFDQLLEHARENGIYIQLCVDPSQPQIGQEKANWGGHAYVRNFVEPTRSPPLTGLFDVKNFFYSYDNNGTPQQDSGVFYYWKRKYKYLMARWGYSVNIAAFEPLNEPDQILGYRDNDLSPTSESPHDDLCDATAVHWPPDPQLPGTLNNWLTDLIGYVKGPVDPLSPATSPLGESNRLFALSYTDTKPASDLAYYAPLRNPALDLIDVHKYMYDGEYRLKSAFEDNQEYRNNFTSTDDGHRKPLRNGESNYFASIDLDGDPQATREFSTNNIFSNYDVSFHNEIWSSTFYGNYACASTWQWERVFWWEDALIVPPQEDIMDNPFQFGPFSNVLGHEPPNHLNVEGQDIPVYNRTLFHNFKPLADMLSNEDFQAYHFFNGDFSAHETHDDGHKIECYYLLKEPDHDLAIGWVHNRNAYWENQYYATHANQHFLDCTAPFVDWHNIWGFQPGVDYHITWFPTRMNTTERPADFVDDTGSGLISLDLSTAPLGGVANNYLDTLHSDYAFIVSRNPVVRSMEALPVSAQTGDSSWDFMLYPNPASDELFLQLPDDSPKDIVLQDLAGRRINAWSSVIGPVLRLPLGQLAHGAYSLRVTDGAHSKVKKLIIR